MSVHTKTRHIRRPAKRPAKPNKKAVKKAQSIPWSDAFKNIIERHSTGGAVLRGSRYKNEISQRKLAKELGISQHHISEMENGKRPIGKEMAKRFAVYFDTDYRIFL